MTILLLSGIIFYIHFNLQQEAMLTAGNEADKTES